MIAVPRGVSGAVFGRDEILIFEKIDKARATLQAQKADIMNNYKSKDNPTGIIVIKQDSPDCFAFQNSWPEAHYKAEISETDLK